MKFSKFKTNQSLEIEGVWVDIGEGAKVKVARIGNTAYQKYLERSYKPYRKMQRTGTVPEDLQRRLFIEALAHTILLDWDGFTDDADKPVVYSVDAAISQLTEFKDFRELIVEIAAEAETFRDEEIEEEAELLAKKSSGTSSGEVDSTN